jgi:26S proteasome regulatory subunit N9
MTLCFKMCLSSLVGEKMFNTSEFIEKDFFKILSNSKYDWIFKLILSFNSAKVEQFEQMLNNYKDNINSEEILKNNFQLIQVKIRIAALLDLIFQKNKNERVLSFKEISQVCYCSMNDIEILLVKAMSLGLIRGHIDEVENKLVVDWIQPKYLDSEKITILHDRIGNWIQKSEKVLVYFQQITGPLLN